MAEAGAAKFKMTYFGAPGRAEVSKLCAAIADLEFEEEILTRQNWGEIKPKTPWGSAPYATMADGSVKGQSKALGRYFAKKAGLYPSNKMQAAQADAVYDYVEDILTSISKKNEEDDHKDRKADFAEDGKIRKMFQRLNDYIGKTGENGFAVGKCLSLADICIFVYANNTTSGFFDLYPKPAEAFKGMDNINAVRASVAGIPQVQARYAADFPGKDGFKGFIEAADLKGETKVEAGSWEKDAELSGKPTITYFALPGRAELSRVLFTMAGVEFEDKMIQFAEWPELKTSGKLPLGDSLPLLEFPDGTMLSESLAMARYIASCTGMYPEDAEIAHRTDAIVDVCKDIMMINYKLGDDNAPAWEEGGKANVLTKKLDAYLTALGGKCAACDEVTWADVSVFVLSSMMGELACKAASAFPKVAEIKKAMAANETLPARYSVLKENPKYADFIKQSGMTVA